jgi:hypothetical protein
MPMLSLSAEHATSDDQAEMFHNTITIFFNQRRALPLPKRRERVLQQPNGLAFALSIFDADVEKYLQAWHKATAKYGRHFGSLLFARSGSRF